MSNGGKEIETIKNEEICKKKKFSFFSHAASFLISNLHLKDRENIYQNGLYLNHLTMH